MQTMNLQCELGLLRPEELTPISQGLIPQELACAFNIPHASSTSNGTGAAPVSSDVLNFSPSGFESVLHMHSVLLPLSKLEQTFKAEAEHPTLQGAPDIEVKGMIRVSNTDKESSDLNESVQVNQERETEFLMAGALSSMSPWHDYGNVVGHGVSPFSDRVSRSVASLQNHMAGLAMSISEVGSGNADRGPGVAPEASSAMQLRLDSSEEVDSGSSIDPLQCSRVALLNEDHSARTLKKPRLVWTPQLHKRFVDAVAHLGIKNAVPKTIMQLMNVDGLKRENVASHLQKYRLYLKRIQGLSTEGPSSSDHLFASTPLPPSLASAHFFVSHQNLNNGDCHPAGMPDMLGHGVHNLPPHLRSPTPSCSPRFDAPAAFSSLSRPPLTILISSEQMREAYGQHSSSPHGGILTLFPTSSS